ncbi:hypothetical protein BD410DRAFT_445797 [Rickenella mellea]|uniref:Uncharacterized protein n=1 Tax=Rickenella mellea TaxID=50990 RepID=A0A4Y7PWC4_9AGAM|nr:hypothetical protein BD410DRAFT_445797 [Rickenella mellea]
MLGRPPSRPTTRPASIVRRLHAMHHSHCAIPISRFHHRTEACICVFISTIRYESTGHDVCHSSTLSLTYPTSTSPRIREILTCDGGLEKLIRVLSDFCLSPPPPDAISDLRPPILSRLPTVPALNPKIFDRHTAYRFFLDLQGVVNIGVRGCVAQSLCAAASCKRRTLDVVGVF